MSKRISVADRLKTEKKESPRDALFSPKETEELKKKEVETFKRQTYYVNDELVDALIMYKAFEDKDISVIVREALYSYIPEEYLEKARAKRNK